MRRQKGQFCPPSNIDYPDVPEGINDTMNFWPKLRMQLHCLGLEDIITGAEKNNKTKKQIFVHNIQEPIRCKNSY